MTELTFCQTKRVNPSQFTNCRLKGVEIFLEIKHYFNKYSVYIDIDRMIKNDKSNTIRTL